MISSILNRIEFQNSQILIRLAISLRTYNMLQLQYTYMNISTFCITKKHIFSVFCVETSNLWNRSITCFRTLVQKNRHPTKPLAIEIDYNRKSKCAVIDFVRRKRLWCMTQWSLWQELCKFWIPANLKGSTSNPLIVRLKTRGSRDT